MILCKPVTVGREMYYTRCILLQRYIFLFLVRYNTPLLDNIFCLVCFEILNYLKIIYRVFQHHTEYSNVVVYFLNLMTYIPQIE
jgi:hypothetical protein